MGRKIQLNFLVILFLIFNLIACGEEGTVTPKSITGASSLTTHPTESIINSSSGSINLINNTPTDTVSSISITPGILPAPPNSSEVKTDISLINFLLDTTNLPNNLMNTLQVYLYASNDNLDTFVANYVKALQAASFKPFSVIPSIPSTNLLNKRGQQYIGFVKSDLTEALIAVQSNNDNFTSDIASTGVSPDTLMKLTNQIKGKKVVVIVVAGPGLNQLFTPPLSLSPTPSLTPSLTPTTTK